MAGNQNRKSIRLPGYDYRQPGGYFITICAFQRECLFGTITDGELRLNRLGLIIQQEWEWTAKLRDYIQLDEFIVMPNHIHAIFFIQEHPLPTIQQPNGPKPGSVGAIIGQFKSITAKKANAEWGVIGAPVWQRGYYDHILRDAQELDRARFYIRNNVVKWEQAVGMTRDLPGL